MELPLSPLTVIRLGRADQRLCQAGIGPTDLHQEIVGASKGNQPSLHRLLAMRDTGRRPKTLRRDRADRSEGILDAVMQFAKDQLLQLVGGFSFLGVDAGLCSKDLASMPACSSSRRRLSFSADKTASCAESGKGDRRFPVKHLFGR